MSGRDRRLEFSLFVLILLVGAILRLVALGSVPPGLTHDEADHGIDAVGVLEGHRPLYFTVGYGREPLFDYATALVMLVVGRNSLAGRLTAALFGITLLVLVYVWTRLATQNRWLALATMAGLALSFWGVSTSRQALRSVTLPVLYMVAALAMRRGIVIEEDIEEGPLAPGYRPQAQISRMGWFVVAGAFLGLSIYTYLAARLMWLVFPTFFVFLSVTQPGVIRKAWPGLLVMLLVAAAVSAPLAIYLIQHPQVEVRVRQLSGPIAALLAGDMQPMQQNIRAGLGMITVRGDDLWLYNIPGKPLLGPVMGLFFYLGVSIALMSVLYPYRPAQRGHRSFDEAFRVSSANAFMLLTLIFGMIPALLTGVGASMTRVIGAQPALYYFPALAVVWLADWAQRQVGEQGATALWTAYGGLLTMVGALTIHSYFGIWANARDVRVAYHTTLVETLHYLDQRPEIGPDLALSTITPGRFHDPAIAALVLQRNDLRLRWFDGRSALVLIDPPPAYYLFPEIAPLAAPLEAWLPGVPIDRLELRPNDFNRQVTIVRQTTSLPEYGPPQVIAGGLLALVNYSIEPLVARPGGTIQVLTMWRILDRSDADLVLFTHALDGAGQLVTQQDSLDVPSWGWVPGDHFIQLHRLLIPPDLASCILRVVVGVYQLPDVTRLPLLFPGGAAGGDNLAIGTIEVCP